MILLQPQLHFQPKLPPGPVEVTGDGCDGGTDIFKGGQRKTEFYRNVSWKFSRNAPIVKETFIPLTYLYFVSGNIFMEQAMPRALRIQSRVTYSLSL